MRWAFDWQYWWYDWFTVHFGWPGTDFVWPVPMNRTAMWCSIGAGVVFAAAFAGWAFSQWKGPINMIDE